MQQAQVRRLGNPVLRNGLIYGAMLAGVNVLGVIIQWVSGYYQSLAQSSSGPTSSVGVASLLNCLAFLVGLSFCFISGMNTASVTGRPGSGALAGLITGLVGELVGRVPGLILVLIFVLPNLTISASSALTSSQVDALVVASAIAGLLIGLIIDGGIGAGAGYLGGLVGSAP